MLEGLRDGSFSQSLSTSGAERHYGSDKTAEMHFILHCEAGRTQERSAIHNSKRNIQSSKVENLPAFTRAVLLCRLLGCKGVGPARGLSTQEGIYLRL